MKNFLMVLIFILGSSYYFIPFDTKVSLVEMVWIDSSFMVEKEPEIIVTKWIPVTLEFDKEKKITFKWDISNWVVMDLAWASKPFVKCFYAKDYVSFDWNVNLHRLYLAKNKNVTVKMIQDNPDDKLSMYVYKTDPVSKVFPPEKTHVTECHKNIDISSEKTIEMNWNTAPSDIVIWVTWMNWTLEWGYSIEVVYR